jgi:PEP-CTERM motif
VYSDPDNVYCAGCYDFVISLASDVGSTDAIQHITDGAFDPSEVTVGYAGGTGTVAPDGVSRTSTGKTIAFLFDGTDITGGESVDTLVIQTSKQVVSPGSLVIADDISSNQAGFGDNAVPEPTTLGLLGGGLVLLGAVSRIRFRRT